MNTNDDKIWGAYLDGELSATEAAELDAALTPRQRERVARELQFESALADRLTRGEGCPASLWAAIVERAEAAEGAAPSRVLGGWWWAVSRTTLVAAGLLIVSAVYFWETPPETGIPFLYIAEAHVDDFSELSQTAATRDAMQQFLADHGLDLSLRPLDSLGNGEGQDAVLLGARALQWHNESIVELLFECHDAPVKIVVVRRGTRAAELMERAAGCGEIGEFREVGSYAMGVVSCRGRYAAGLLDCIGERTGCHSI